jgi:hypothetical protein
LKKIPKEVVAPDFPERSEAFEDLNRRLMEEKLQVATTSASWPSGHLFWAGLVVHFG